MRDCFPLVDLEIRTGIRPTDIRQLDTFVPHPKLQKQEIAAAEATHLWEQYTYLAVCLGAMFPDLVQELYERDARNDGNAWRNAEYRYSAGHLKLAT